MVRMVWVDRVLRLVRMVGLEWAVRNFRMERLVRRVGPKRVVGVVRLDRQERILRTERDIWTERN